MGINGPKAKPQTLFNIFSNALQIYNFLSSYRTRNNPQINSNFYYVYITKYKTTLELIKLYKQINYNHSITFRITGKLNK